MSKIISLSILAMAISMASAAPSSYGSVKQISDNDLVDTKDTTILADVLKREPGWRHSNYRQPSVVQYNDNDAVDLKGLTLGLDILKREPTWRHSKQPKITQINDNDLLDLKDTTILADILKREPEPRRHHRNSGPKITQINDNDLLDLKDTTILADILKREPKVTQINDDDGVDTKDTVVLADVLKRNAPAPSVFQYSDNDLVDAKDLTLLADILKRSGYEVEKRDEHDQELESRGLGGDGLFFRRDRGDQRCVCVKKTTCNKSPKQYKAQPEHTRTHHWKPTPTWTKTRTHHYQAEPTRHHHNNDWSCPSGFGDITQINDNDLIDLKDTSIILNILGGNAAENKEENVPARDARSRCKGRRCCVKNSSITQINDNDLIDAKGVSVSVGLLNGLLPTPAGGLLDNIAKPTGGLLGGAGDGLLGGLGL